MRLVQLDIKLRITGPIRKPTKPIPETIEIPTDAGTPLVLPAKRNNSGMIQKGQVPKYQILKR